MYSLSTGFTWTQPSSGPYTFTNSLYAQSSLRVYGPEEGWVQPSLYVDGPDERWFQPITVDNTYVYIYIYNKVT